MKPRYLSVIGIVAGLFLAGCQVESNGLFPTGTPFILSGTATLLDSNGPCLVWVGDNGVTYHLFQGIGLDNDTFDRVTTPGTQSRLRLATRSDLVVTCQIGTIVEVQDVLEIVD